MALLSWMVSTLAIAAVLLLIAPPPSSRQEQPEGSDHQARNEVKAVMEEEQKKSAALRLEAHHLSKHKARTEKAESIAAERRKSRLETEAEMRQGLDQERAQFFEEHGPVRMEVGEFDARPPYLDRASRDHDDMRRKHSFSDEFTDRGRYGAHKERHPRVDRHPDRESRHNDGLHRLASKFRSRASRGHLGERYQAELDELVDTWMKEEQDLMDYRTKSKYDRVEPQGDMRDPEVRAAFREVLSKEVESRKEKEKSLRSKVAETRAKIEAMLNARPGGGDEV